MEGWELILTIIFAIGVIAFIVYMIRIYGDMRAKEEREYQRNKQKEAEQREQVKQGRLKTMGRCGTCKYADCARDCHTCVNRITDFGFSICRCVKNNFDKNENCPYYKEKENKNVDIQ